MTTAFKKILLKKRFRACDCEVEDFKVLAKFDVSPFSGLQFYDLTSAGERALSSPFIDYTLTFE